MSLRSTKLLSRSHSRVAQPSTFRFLSSIYTSSLRLFSSTMLNSRSFQSYRSRRHLSTFSSLNQPARLLKQNGTQNTIKSFLNSSRSQSLPKTRSNTIHANALHRNSSKKFNPAPVISTLGKRHGSGGLDPVINNPYTGTTHAASEDDFLNPAMGQYVDNMYGQWANDPTSVDNSWQDYFQSGKFMKPSSSSIRVPNMPRTASGALDMNSTQMLEAVNKATNLIKYVHAYQAFGHFVAHLDPLGILDQGVDRKQFKPELLNRNYWGFTEADLDTPLYVGEHSQLLRLMGVNDGWLTLRAVEKRMQQIYCGTIGFQYMHIANHQKNNFIRQQIERDADVQLSPAQKKQTLERLMWAVQFEEFLEIKYPAQKRFGANGAESFVPLLKEIIDEGARLGIREYVIGMPHRGRLLCLATVLRKPLEQILYEFRGLATPWYDINDTGDVKYHLGASMDRVTPDGHEVHLSLFPNPSHLEAVNPIVAGKTRAKQFYKKDEDRSKTACILIHGDASFAGQGVVYESMALTDLPDYTTGGVFHVIVNNQIGFTTDAFQARSSPYCTDVARGIAAPIFHVNGDDPESVVKCAKYAAAFRQNFKTDVVVDMLCFRRYGHNEGDEPSFTQPLMYQVINQKMKQNDTVLEKYKKKLLDEGVVTQEEIDKTRNMMVEHMNECYEKSSTLDGLQKPGLEGPNWRNMRGVHEKCTEWPTGLKQETLKSLGNQIFGLPSNFNFHRKLNKIYQQRREMIEKGEGIDWGCAEAMAYGSLLLEGYDVRLSGQDSERGTFSHRHAVLHEQKNVDKFHRPQYRPLENIDGAKGEFQICNSNLSEYAVCGFEYGYSCENPNALVLWEAQFGDFANGAQVVFDQFVSSAEAKWLRQSGLTLLLPHGYEGGGPEHSSARIERYLQMCADDPDHYLDDPLAEMQLCNWQVCNITTPANFFHALRRQMQRDFRKPLVVATPKFGLKHNIAVSKLSEMEEGTEFKTVLEDDGFGLQSTFKADDRVRRLIFCSGKIWINLVDYRKKQTDTKGDAGFDDVVITRVEQISPFPYGEVKRLVEKYPNAEIVWLQEEPKNMGAWSYVAPRFDTAFRNLTDKRPRYIGRRGAAAPATGYPQVHMHQHEQLIMDAFDYLE